MSRNLTLLVGATLGSLLILRMVTSRYKKEAFDVDESKVSDINVNMYKDWISIKNCNLFNEFKDKWSNEIQTLRINGMGDLIDKFQPLWELYNPSLAGDLYDRIKTFNHEISMNDPSEYAITDTPEMAAKRREKIKMLLIRSYAPELVRPLAFENTCQ